MTCEYNPDPCDTCKRRFCPDMVEDIVRVRHELREELQAARDNIIKLECQLASYNTQFDNIHEEYEV